MVKRSVYQEGYHYVGLDKCGMLCPCVFSVAMTARTSITEKGMCENDHSNWTADKPLFQYIIYHVTDRI